MSPLLTSNQKALRGNEVFDNITCFILLPACVTAVLTRIDCHTTLNKIQHLAFNERLFNT